MAPRDKAVVSTHIPHLAGGEERREDVAESLPLGVSAEEDGVVVQPGRAERGQRLKHGVSE